MEFKAIDLIRYDYLVIDCGYVDRLFRRADDIIKQTTLEADEYNGEEHALMFFANTDYDLQTEKWTHYCHPYQDDPDKVYDTLVELTNEGKLPSLDSACFKKMDGDIPDCVELLRKYRHCSCFSNEPHTIAVFKTKSGKTVLYKAFDTESG